MKKILLMIFIAVTTISCGKDEPAEITPEKPSIVFLSVRKGVFSTPSGPNYHLSVDLTLKLPEEGAVKALDYIKNGTRLKDKGPDLKNGLNYISIYGGLVETDLNGTYTFILVLKDGSEVTSAPQVVK